MYALGRKRVGPTSSFPVRYWGVLPFRRSYGVAKERSGRGLTWPISSILIVILFVSSVVAGESDVFDKLLGAWRGSGQVTFVDGQPESIKCNAYYTRAGRSVRFAIRCASSSGSGIEVRGVLSQDREIILGTWEERTLNTSGDAKGRVAGNKIALSISGGGLIGSMSVSVDGPTQVLVMMVVAISTQDVKMKSANITLSKY